MKLIFLLLCSFVVCSAALSACASGVTCPTGGIWSEWSTTDTCSTSCGSCSKMYYTRKCLSASANCTCSGNFSMYVLCNTQTCLYPSQKSCCTPYLSMLINGSMQCGPLPKESSSTTSCCPVGGLWSEWSKFGNNGTAWVRSRNCVSLEAGCSCTGSLLESKTSCPCTAPTNIGSDKSVSGNYFHYEHNATIDQTTCSYTAYLLTTTDTYNKPCRSGNTVLVRYLKPGSASSAFVEFRPFPCDAVDLPKNNKYTMHCNSETLNWEMDYDNSAVSGWVQINVVTPQELGQA